MGRRGQAPILAAGVLMGEWTLSCGGKDRMPVPVFAAFIAFRVHFLLKNVPFVHVPRFHEIGETGLSSPE